MPLLYVAVVVAVVLLVQTRMLPFRYFRRIRKTMAAKKKKKDERAISSFSACCTALGNTLGVGNIAGVAVAIALGGPGALFWLWIANVLGVIIKYSESVLGGAYRKVDRESGYYHGGIMWYIEGCLGKNWKWLSVLYAAIYGIADLVYPATQLNSVVGAIENAAPIPPITVGAVSAILMGVVIIGGIRRLSEMAEKIIPVMATVYVLAVVIILIDNIAVLPSVFADVFACAVTPAAAAGGFAGASASMAVRHGIARGFYSNGAGNGDAAFAHAAADVLHPVEQGTWAMIEVIVDAVICSSTALLILSTGVLETGLSGAALTTAAFATVFGSRAAAVFVGIIIFLFAFTTAVVSAYYGELCLKYIIQKEQIVKWILGPYKILMCLSAVAGSVMSLELLWGITDFFMALCMFICLFVLFLSRKKIAELTKDYISKYSGSQEKRTRV